jgi:Binding-protein-dependent transport system inner membrane component
VRKVDTAKVRAAQALGATGRQLICHVVLPHALPDIVSGIRIGFGVGWISASPFPDVSPAFFRNPQSTVKQLNRPLRVLQLARNVPAHGAAAQTRRMSVVPVQQQ